MDSVLTEFISKTSAEPALARDILESNKWILNDALKDFNYMNEIVKPKLIETNLDDELLGKNESSSPEVKLDFKIDFRTDKIETKMNSKPSSGPKCDSTLKTVHHDSKPDTLVKSNSHPLLNGTSSSKTVIDNEPNVLIKLNNKSIDKLSNNLTAEQQPVVQKKLFRGISRATDNINLVQKVRGEFAQDFQSIKDNDSFTENLALELPEHSFVMPDLSIHPDDFRQFLEKDLIEKSTLISLKSAKRLNWWADLNIAQELWPLVTTGDGNCLLHAASLCTWGFHDRLLTLRKALHYYLINSSSNVDSFYKRWRFQCTLENKKAGLILGEEEWTNDWQNLLKMASTEPRVVGNSYVKTTKTIELNGGKKEICEEEFANHVYESLEEIHILALAHVLKRPIIVIADTVLKDINNQPFAPIPFGGIYLPLLCDPKECNKAPLCLTYDAAHFSSLIAMDHESYADRTPLPPAVIPLVDWESKLLPVQFIVEPPADLKYEEDDSVIEKLSVGEHDKISLLDKYLDLVYINKETKEVLSSEKFKKQQNQEKPIKDEEESKNESLPDASNGSCSPNPNKLSVNSSKLLNSKNLSSSANLGSSNAVTTGLSERRKKSFNFGSLSSLTQKFSSLRRSMSKKFRRNLNTVNANINSLARRSSFRLSRRASKLNKSESQTKSTNNLETGAVSNISLNSPTSKSATADKSPSKSSSKSPIKSAKSPTKSLKSVSSCGTTEQAEPVTKPEEESIIPSQLVLAAELHLDKLPSYRDEFIRNYLATARFRFLNECDSRSTTEKSVQKVNNSSEYSSHKGSTVSCASSSNTSLNSASNFKEGDYATQCVSNVSCQNFGKSSTNYLCEQCFISQKKELIEIESTIKSES